MKWKLSAIASFNLFFTGLLFFLVHAANIPSMVIATPAVPFLAQYSYRWYQNIDGLDPTTPAAAEGASVSSPSVGAQARLRMNMANTGGATLAAGATFALQYANTTSGPWTSVSTSTAWAFFNNPSVADGQTIVNLLLGSSTAGESYGESNPSAAMPIQLLSGNIGEWDWSLVNVSATTSLDWFFRMVNASGTSLDAYGRYPALTAVAPSGGGGPSGGGSPQGGGGGGGGGGTGYYWWTGTTTSVLLLAPPLLPPQFQVADFNGDNRVDISDLSIMLYYYGRSDDLALRYDLNKDGVVDFPDVSILMYYWTGS